MVSVPSSPATAAISPAPRHSHPIVTRIAPPRGLFNLRLAELWAYRELLYFFVWRDVKIRYKQTAIGVLWVVLQPLLTMLVFTLFFGRLAKLPSDGLPYPVFYFSALVPWIYFNYALHQATNVVVENQRMITKVYFPRLVLPFSSVLSGLDEADGEIDESGEDRRERQDETRKINFGNHALNFHDEVGGVLQGWNEVHPRDEGGG